MHCNSVEGQRNGVNHLEMPFMRETDEKTEEVAGAGAGTIDNGVVDRMDENPLVETDATECVCDQLKRLSAESAGYFTLDGGPVTTVDEHGRESALFAGSFLVYCCYASLEDAGLGIKRLNWVVEPGMFVSVSVVAHSSGDSEDRWCVIVIIDDGKLVNTSLVHRCLSLESTVDTDRWWIDIPSSEGIVESVSDKLMRLSGSCLADVVLGSHNGDLIGVVRKDREQVLTSMRLGQLKMVNDLGREWNHMMYVYGEE